MKNLKYNNKIEANTFQCCLAPINSRNKYQEVSN